MDNLDYPFPPAAVVFPVNLNINNPLEWAPFHFEEDLADPPPPPILAPDMADPAAALQAAITAAFQNVRRDAMYTVPQFSGKKGEKPEAHCLKVEDWFAHFAIPNDQKVLRFKETLTGKARQWYESLHPVPTDWIMPDPVPDPPPAAGTILKPLFNQRFSLKGKTPDALYAEWQHLKFDPGTEDIEEFINDVEDLATQLGYPDRAKIMAIKGCMPMEILGSCFNIDNLATLKAMLINIFDNPRMKSKYAKSGNEASTSGATPFSVMTKVTPATVSDTTYSNLSSLSEQITTLQADLSSMTMSPNQKPFKPYIAPKRGRGGRFQGPRNVGNRTQSGPPPRFQKGPNHSFQPRGQRGGFYPRNQNRGNQRYGNSRGPGQNQTGFQRSPVIRKPRIASKTVDKDRQRCHYCKEIGHFIRECRKKQEDERTKTAYRLYDIVEEEQPNECFEELAEFDFAQPQLDTLNH